MSPNTALQAVKQDILPRSQFFDSLSLQPLASIDELFQRGNQYDFLKDDVIATTKRMVASASESRSYSRDKGNRSRSEQDERSKPEARFLELNVSRKEGDDLDDYPTNNAKFLHPN